MTIVFCNPIYSNYFSIAEATIDFDLVKGKCQVLYSDNLQDLQAYFLGGSDRFYFAEVYMCIINSQLFMKLDITSKNNLEFEFYIAIIFHSIALIIFILQLFLNKLLDTC